ncbi:hypothetical protein FRC00_008510, partial [Tulasnella sp. 408]
MLSSSTPEIRRTEEDYLTRIDQRVLRYAQITRTCATHDTHDKTGFALAYFAPVRHLIPWKSRAGERTGGKTSVWKWFEMLEAHPEIKEKYLAANVFYKPPNEPGAELRQLGSTHRTWTTGSGRKITAIGVMFENEKKTKEAGVYIERVESIVNQTWFKEKVLTSDPDVFVLAGHMSLSADERPKWRSIHQAIRNRYPHTPVFIFAGHTHVRECLMGMNHENPIRSLGIESGRYIETVGWVGANMTAPTQPLELSRIHIDASRQTLIGLTGADASIFSQSSDNVMRPFHELARRFGLNQYIGCLKNDYPWDTKEYNESDPLHSYNLYRNVAFPDVVPPKGAGPYMLLLNNGFIRGPLYSGAFRLNDK